MSTLKSENAFLRLERSLEAVAPGLVKHSRLCVKRLSCRLSKLVAFALEQALLELILPPNQAICGFHLPLGSFSVSILPRITLHFTFLWSLAF